MAVLFGNFLRSRGTPFSVYGLCWPYAQRYSLSVARKQEELLRGKDLLVWGGGGLLVPWNPAVYGLLFPRVAAEFSALVGAARAGDVRICALSVGGAVGSPSGLTPRYKEDLITNAEYVSVRNPQDLPMLEGRGIRGAYFPDIVWSVRDLLPVQRRRNPRPTVGIDLYLGNLVRNRCLRAVPLLRRIMRARDDCDFILTDSTNRSVRGYRALGRILRGRNVHRYQFHDLAEDLGLLASLDLLVSNRLHTGVVAMAHGVPFFSLAPEGKTRTLMGNLGLAHLCIGPGNLGLLEERMLGGGGLESLEPALTTSEVEALSRGSRGHLEALDRLLGDDVSANHT